MLGWLLRRQRRRRDGQQHAKKDCVSYSHPKYVRRAASSRHDWNSFINFARNARLVPLPETQIVGKRAKFVKGERLFAESAFSARPRAGLAAGTEWIWRVNRINLQPYY